MNDRFRFRIPITNLYGQFDRFIFCDVYHEPIHFIGSAIFLTPEQCTGLKDKNGRLIYEGDIIASRFQDQLFTANIKYFRAGWVAEFPHWKPSLYQMCNEAKFEVIGNIHENPEILEDK